MSENKVKMKEYRKKLIKPGKKQVKVVEKNAKSLQFEGSVKTSESESSFLFFKLDDEEETKVSSEGICNSFLLVAEGKIKGKVCFHFLKEQERSRKLKTLPLVSMQCVLAYKGDVLAFTYDLICRGSDSENLGKYEFNKLSLTSAQSMP